MWLGCSSLYGEDDEDTSGVWCVVCGVIIENLTMQPNNLLIFKSDHSSLRPTSYVFCLLLQTVWIEKYNFLIGRKSPGWLLFSTSIGPPWLSGCHAGYWLIRGSPVIINSLFIISRWGGWRWRWTLSGDSVEWRHKLRIKKNCHEKVSSITPPAGSGSPTDSRPPS